MKKTNDRNLNIYRAWAPVYDFLTGWVFISGRRKSVNVLKPYIGEKVLLVGVGTGADLPLLPEGIHVHGVDLSPEMLAKAEARLPLPGLTADLSIADAQNLPMEDGVYDSALLSLIVSVVPDGRQCLKEALRVVRPGGYVVVFDKFGKAGKVGFARRLINRITVALGTDITRSFEEMVTGLNCEIVSDTPALIGDFYRSILLRRV